MADNTVAEVTPGLFGRAGEAFSEFAQNVLSVRQFRQAREAEELQTAAAAIPLFAQGNTASGVEALLAAGETGKAVFERLPRVLGLPDAAGADPAIEAKTFTKLTGPAATILAALVEARDQRDGLAGLDLETGGSRLEQRKGAQQETRATTAEAKTRETKAAAQEREISPRLSASRETAGEKFDPRAMQALLPVRLAQRSAIASQAREAATLETIGKRVDIATKLQTARGEAPGQVQARTAFVATLREQGLARQERTTAARVGSEVKLQERIIASKGRVDLGPQKADLERILSAAAQEVTDDPDAQRALVADSLAQGRLVLDLENAPELEGIDQLLNARLTSVKLSENISALQADVNLQQAETALLAEFRSKGKLDAKDEVALGQLIDRSVAKLGLSLTAAEKSSLVKELLISGALGGAAAALTPGGPVKRGVVGILSAIGAFLTQRGLKKSTATATPTVTPSKPPTIGIPTTELTAEEEATERFLQLQGIQ